MLPVADSSPANASALRDRTQQARGIPVYIAARETFSALGVKVDAVQIPEVICKMQEWIERRDACRYIAVTEMHVVTEAQHRPNFKQVLSDADLVVPDGMPLVWIGRWRGKVLQRRVYGPELMLTFCRETASMGYRHFLYGGEACVPERLAQTLKKSCPGICIAGTYSPPFRPVTPEEDQAIVEMINQAAPDVLWVGLGAPKQETWMHQHRDKLRVPVMAGVGAAFDLLSFRKKQAPRWMRENGLEWLFRLFQEPRRLWRRYLVNGSEFVFLAALDLLGLRDFD
jgi:N-acetylglucosaminyldiphosphoundecaprenol N-acetyl-beta-D-mannosaminyltransferase